MLEEQRPPPLCHWRSEFHIADAQGLSRVHAALRPEREDAPVVDGADVDDSGRLARMFHHGREQAKAAAVWLAAVMHVRRRDTKRPERRLQSRLAAVGALVARGSGRLQQISRPLVKAIF